MNIALIYNASSAKDTRDAERYVSALPPDACIWVHARNGSATSACRAAGDRYTMVVTRPENTLRLANIVVVFGKNPFSSDDLRVLSEQGVPVELNRKNGCRKKQHQEE